MSIPLIHTNYEEFLVILTNLGVWHHLAERPDGLRHRGAAGETPHQPAQEAQQVKVLTSRRREPLPAPRTPFRKAPHFNFQARSVPLDYFVRQPALRVASLSENRQNI